MLYVFLVNTGHTLTFDMQLAMQTVAVLKSKIAESSRIPPDKQVLLISGGEWLDSEARVGSYSAGTDTSPIFLFSKQGEPPQLMPPTDTMQTSDEIEDQVAGSLTLPPSYSTVVSRSQLAQQIFEQGKEQVRQCDQLIHEQHMQQQGWSAVVANTDDTSQQLENTGVSFTSQFEKYLTERPAHYELVAAFEADLQLLARIPMLAELGGSLSSGPIPEGTSLLDWISTHDTGRLEDVCEGAETGLEQLNPDLLQKMTTELRQLLDPAVNAEMTEIRGLEERLMRLDELRHRAQTTVSEQKELAKAFIQNQARASCVNDPSVLPDLCASHCTQLQVMLEKHKVLVDARRRCAKAKEELSSNIHARLAWVISVQRRMNELTGTLLLNSERLKKLREQLAILATLHQAPTLYLTAVAEVVRRRQFTGRFLEWAGTIAGHAAAVHTAETAARARFAATFRSHFFRSVFPGLEQVPPPFAAVCPTDYDARLPVLGDQHVQWLREAVPELAHLLDVPEERPPLPLPGAAVSAPPHHGPAVQELRDGLRAVAKAVNKEVVQFGDALGDAGDRLARAVAAVAAAERQRAEELRQRVQSLEEQLAAQISEREAEQAAAGAAHEQTVRQLTLEQTVELERAEERVSRLEQELEEQRVTAGRLRAQLDAGSDRERIVAILEASFQERERKAVEACADRLRAEQEVERRAAKEAHDAQLQRHTDEQRTKLILEWKEVSEKQKREIEERAARHVADLQAEQARQAERQAAQAVAEKQAAVQAVTDRLRAEHRAEVQALRSRFRMMTSNLGSPSDGSSENLPVGSPPSEGGARQRTDSGRRLPTLAERDSLLEQLRSARRDVLSAARAHPSAELQRAAERLADGETRLLQAETAALAEPAGGSEPGLDAQSVRRLQRDNERLRMQLSRSTSGLLERGQVSIMSCNDGDLVLIVWDADRMHYRVYQEASFLFFVHADCLEALGLQQQQQQQQPRRQYAVAEVVSHEFCQARKEGNRYRVPRGTRFYRVRVKPWTRPASSGSAAAAAGAGSSSSAVSDLSASTRRLSLRSAESVESHEAAS
ncbi:RB1-inducible coiled-coil protein 1 [Amphibalanus amphitrite]|uniref:RB1-inducible coiled-coil protein 1 n=1 Tax=Amphibalanus amphitrite TaxID=1232801 RepID=A0A6A4VF46_AMPAM|nr:RB1-inducible coiled-coil protein 1 [Amphibalanus amphitrite]